MLSVANKPTMLIVVALLITATTISLEKGFIEFFPRQQIFFQLVTTNEKKRFKRKQPFGINYKTFYGRNCYGKLVCLLLLVLRKAFVKRSMLGGATCKY